jgi:hypothetical protein
MYIRGHQFLHKHTSFGDCSLKHCVFSQSNITIPQGVAIRQQQNVKLEMSGKIVVPS